MSVTVASPSSSTSCPLSGVNAATHSSESPATLPGARRAASTPGSDTCTRSAGSAYSSPSRRRVHALVVTTAAAASRTSRSRARTAPASPSGGRWPSGMCTSTTCLQPARLRHERLGGGGGDQPIEQHHGAIRNPPNGAREGGGVAHGVLPHGPAQRGEPVADAAVVGVAAARPRRVVDALRDDDVHLGHSCRS